MASSAFKILAVNSTTSLKPIEGIVSSHQGFTYLIMGGAVVGFKVADPLDQMTKGWKWEALVALSNTSISHHDTRLFLTATGIINFPKDMYVYPTETPDHIFDIGLYDMRNTASPFEAYIQLVPIPKGAEFAQIKDNFLKGMKSQKVYDDQLAWTPRNGDATRLVTHFPFGCHQRNDKTRHLRQVGSHQIRRRARRCSLISRLFF